MPEGDELDVLLEGQVRLWVAVCVEHLGVVVDEPLVVKVVVELLEHVAHEQEPVALFVHLQDHISQPCRVFRVRVADEQQQPLPDHVVQLCTGIPFLNFCLVLKTFMLYIHYFHNER